MTSRVRHLVAIGAATAAALLVTASPAGACAGLVTPGGNVRLLRTSTLAAYHAGVEHYVTSFKFEGGGAEFGSIIPLPGIPSSVERGGDWTLQRLDREVHPVVFAEAAGAAAPTAARSDDAQVIYETRIDALDITVLKGGGRAVGDWARQHGFQLTPDAPEVLDFYAARSPIFLAARFNAQAARDRGQQVGDGTPIHLTIPTRNPWVPLRILGLGLAPAAQVDADVFLLTDLAPALLPRPGVGVGQGLVQQRDEPASDQLLADLRSDKGMAWVPDHMWLTYLEVNDVAGRLRYDLAVDASGRGRPSYVAAGLRRPAPPTTVAPPTTPPPAPTTTAVPSPITTIAGSLIAAPRFAAHEARRHGWWAVGTGAVLLLVVGSGTALAVSRRRASAR